MPRCRRIAVFLSSSCCIRPVFLTSFVLLHVSVSQVHHRSQPLQCHDFDLHMSLLLYDCQQTDPANQNIDENNQIKLYVLKCKSRKKKINKTQPLTTTAERRNCCFQFAYRCSVSLALFLLRYCGSPVFVWCSLTFRCLAVISFGIICFELFVTRWKSIWNKIITESTNNTLFLTSVRVHTHTHTHIRMHIISTNTHIHMP